MLKIIADIFYKLIAYTLAFAFVFIVCAVESIVDLLLKAVGL